MFTATEAGPLNRPMWLELVLIFGHLAPPTVAAGFMSVFLICRLHPPAIAVFFILPVVATAFVMLQFGAHLAWARSRPDRSDDDPGSTGEP